MPLAIREISKSFGEKAVLRGVSHVFPERGASAISGPSGCGKTTLLRILLGLEEPDGGEAHIPKGAKRAAVFQEDRLIPHLSAAANIALVAPDLPAGEIAALLEAVGLDASEKQRVAKYSGGMRRRVALVRALAVRPDILFLDEPFTGLDDAVKEKCAALTRERMRGGLIVVVTHDGDEAALLGCTDMLRLPAAPKEETP